MKTKIIFSILLSTLGIAGLTMQDIINMPAGTWLSVPNTRMDALDPCPARTCSYSGVGGIYGVFDWSGGAFDSKRNQMLIWGGGHNDYRGNEIYAFQVNTLKWARLTDPTLNPTNCADANWDGTPNSRHTYGALAYLTHADRFFNWGGAINCNSGGCAGSRAWLFNFDQSQWTGKTPSGTSPGTGCPGALCSYDPISKKVWFGAGNGSLYSFDHDANTWTKHNNDYFYDIGSAFDNKRGLFIATGDGKVRAYAVRNNNFTAQNWATAGGSAFISKGAVGLDYDPVADRIVGWDGGSVYALNPDTKQWTAHGSSGAPSPFSTGTYGAWRYVPAVNAFIVVPGADVNVYFFKLTAGPGPTSTEAGPAAAGVGLISVTPNPVGGAAMLRVPGVPAGQPVRFEVFDIRGIRIDAFASAGPQYRWEAYSIPRGIYVMRAASAAGIVERRVMVCR